MDTARKLRKRARERGDEQMAAAALSLVAMLHKILGEPSRWRMSLRRLVQESPDEWAHHAELGMAEREAGHLAEAAKAYRRALELYRDDDVEIAGVRPCRELRAVVAEALLQVESRSSDGA
jgi:tetratricopeptide (TPR) repeat protein